MHSNRSWDQCWENGNTATEIIGRRTNSNVLVFEKKFGKKVKYIYDSIPKFSLLPFFQIYSCGQNGNHMKKRRILLKKNSSEYMQVCTTEVE